MLLSTRGSTDYLRKKNEKRERKEKGQKNNYLIRDQIQDEVFL